MMIVATANTSNIAVVNAENVIHVVPFVNTQPVIQASHSRIALSSRVFPFTNNWHVVADNATATLNAPCDIESAYDVARATAIDPMRCGGPTILKCWSGRRFDGGWTPT